MKRALLTPILIPERPLTGRSLLVARLLSAGVMLASLLLFLIALPVRFEWLSRFSAGAERVLLERTLLLNDVIRNLTDAFPYVALGIELGVMLLFFLIAAFLYRMRSHEWLVLLTSAGLVSFALHITPTMKTWMDAEPDLAIIGILFKAIGLGLSFLFLYLFPSGFYAPRWIRLFALLWVVWSVLWLIFPDSIFSFEDPYTIDLVGFVLLMTWWGVGIFAQLYRYLRISGPVERQQTKYITFGATIVAVAYCLYVPLRQLMGSMPRPDLAVVIFYMVAPYIYLILVAAIPITIAFSILRYRLWDIDLFIRRTLVYSALTLTLAVLYFSSVVLMQVLFVAISGRSAGSSSLAMLRSPFAVVISTLGIAALFTPLRKRIQNDIDRRFFRQKYDIEKTLEAFSASLREGLELDELSDLLLDVVEETLQPESVNLWMQKPPSGDDQSDLTPASPV